MLLHKKQTFFHVRRVTWKPIMAGFGIGFLMVFFFQSGQGGCVSPFALAAKSASGAHRCRKSTDLLTIAADGRLGSFLCN